MGVLGSDGDDSSNFRGRSLASPVRSDQAFFAGCIEKIRRAFRKRPEGDDKILSAHLNAPDAGDKIFSDLRKSRAAGDKICSAHRKALVMGDTIFSDLPKLPEAGDRIRSAFRSLRRSAVPVSSVRSRAKPRDRLPKAARRAPRQEARVRISRPTRRLKSAFFILPDRRTPLEKNLVRSTSYGHHPNEKHLVISRPEVLRINTVMRRKNARQYSKNHNDKTTFHWIFFGGN